MDLTDESGDVVTLYAQWEPKPLTNGETFNMYGIKYRVISAEDRTLAVIGYTSDDVDIIIPEKIVRGTECTVIAIDDYAFEDANIESISLPDSIEWIGYGAFSFCMRLTTFEVPASMTDIGEDVFYFCLGLTEFTVSSENDTFESRDGVLFNMLEKSLVAYPANKSDRQYIVPGDVVTISTSAFIAPLNLEELVLSNGVKTLEGYSFRYPLILRSLTIPASVTYIGDSAINNIQSLNVDPENEDFATIDGVLYELDDVGEPNRLVCYPVGKADLQFTVPASVESIDECAFMFAKFKVLDLGNVVALDPLCLSQCYYLETVKISKNTLDIDQYSFFGSPMIKEFIVDKDNPNYSSLDGVLFDKEKSILIYYPGGKTNEHYSIPISVTAIGEMAFEYARNLKSIDLGAYEGKLFNVWQYDVKYYSDEDYEIEAEGPYSGIIYVKVIPKVYTVSLDTN
ncbi:MAG: hypothetical protein E7Z67_06375, partial [Thermoplasmata archaeon]|nr:hypothetical protein [Thermoplasmata archaeon]